MVFLKLPRSATEKIRLSQPQIRNQSPDHRQVKHAPANKPDKVVRSFEPGSRVTDASDLHWEKQCPQITSTDEGM
jgi:hypothetical protein